MLLASLGQYDRDIFFIQTSLDHCGSHGLMSASDTLIFIRFHRFSVRLGDDYILAMQDFGHFYYPRTS